jgi:hypothetical protein
MAMMRTMVILLMSLGKGGVSRKRSHAEACQCRILQLTCYTTGSKGKDKMRNAGSLRTHTALCCAQSSWWSDGADATQGRGEKEVQDLSLQNLPITQ